MQLLKDYDNRTSDKTIILREEDCIKLLELNDTQILNYLRGINIQQLFIPRSFEGTKSVIKIIEIFTPQFTNNTAILFYGDDLDKDQLETEIGILKHQRDAVFSVLNNAEEISDKDLKIIDNDILDIERIIKIDQLKIELIKLTQI